MRVNKIICDICKKEIVLEQGMSLFERVEVKNQLMLSRQKLDEKENVQRKSTDVCNECGSLIEKYIEELKINNKKL